MTIGYGPDGARPGANHTRETQKMAHGNLGRRRDRSARISPGGAARRRRPTVDRLEERTLLAVTSSFAAGVLTIASDAADAITVGLSGGNVLVNGADPDSGALAATDVISIDVTGGPGGNAIDLGAVSATGFENLAEVSVDGLAGDDTIIGSALADALLGGAGDDMIFGLGGADTIQGGTGDDTLVGGQGGDQIFGDTSGDEAATLVGLDATGVALLRFSADDPTVILSTTPITDIPGAETIVGIDARPSTGQIYALTNEAGTGRLYTIDPETGAATIASMVSEALDGTDFGVDFNPTVDLLRIVSDADQDLRVDVASGAATVDGALAYATGDPNEGADPNVVGAAYFNPVAGATSTALFDIDTGLDILAAQNPPNDGTLSTIGELGVGDVTAVLGFDILPGSDRALASMVVDGSAGLYEIDLVSGAATPVGDIGDGTIPVGGLTVLADGPLESDDDTIIWNNTDGSDTIEGGIGTDTQVVNGSSAADAFEIVEGATPGRLSFSRTSPGPFTLDIGAVEVLDVNGRLGDDTFVVADLSGVADLTAVNLMGDEGNDAFAFLDGGSVLAGRIDGGAGSDTISYDGYTTPITVDLDTGPQSYRAVLDGAQEVPPTSSPATGIGTFVLNAAGTELTFTVTYEGLVGQLLGAIGAHFHAPATPGENAPIVRPLTPAELNGSTVPDGTFSGVWTSTDAQPLTPELVEDLRNGLVYFNIHTTDFPAGEIRGQILLVGTEATATGVAELVNVENVVGGQAGDTITGGDTANSLVGGRGGDTIMGGSGDDTIIWNNGDGSDLIDGQEGVDTQVVNGAPAGDDFEVSANGTRLSFQRTNLIPFTLDIGTVEALEVNAGLGTDTVTINDLTGVADLERIDVDGESDNDSIDATALPAGLVAATLRGGPGNDTILGSQGDDSIFGGQGDDTIVGGRGADQIVAGITAEDALFAAVTSDNTALIFTADATAVVDTVTFTGLEEGETVIGADYRAGEALDVLYLVTDQGRIYTSPPTGEVTLLSTLTADPDDPTDPFDGLDGTSFGVDFNPVPDRLRVVSNTGQNLRIDVDTGATITDGDLAFAAGDPNAGGTPDVVAAAYTNSVAGATSTMLFDVDATLDALLSQLPPNDGTLNTIGLLGADTSEQAGLDILPGAEQTAFASLTVGGVVGLYRVDLSTGSALLVGTIGDGTAPIVGLAAAPDNDTIIWNNGDGSDVVDGGLGVDVQQVNGSGADETFAISAGPGGRVLFQRTNPGPFSIDLGTVERIEVSSVGGNDSVTVGDLGTVEGLVGISADLGEGDDLLDASGLVAALPVVGGGGDGNDTLIGGPGNDTLDGGPGNNRLVPNAGENVVRNGKTTAGDYDGDGIADLSSYLFDEFLGAGIFQLELSTGGQRVEQFSGLSENDIPITGDFDGDGLADLAVVQPFGNDTQPDASVWAYIQSSDDTRVEIPFGATGALDRPAPADYDGDAITDLATFRADSDLTPGAAEWFVRPSSDVNAGFRVVFGAPGGTDLPAIADYDADGKADIATFRPIPTAQDLANGVPQVAQTFILPSGVNQPLYATTAGAQRFLFGAPDNADQPVPADYNGDGRDDIGLFRSVTDLPTGDRWFILPSSGAFPGVANGFPVNFGEDGDIAAVSDYTGDGAPDLAVYDTDAGIWTIGDTDGNTTSTRTFNPTGLPAVPVLSPLFFRLSFTGNIPAASTALARAEADPGTGSASRGLLGPLVDEVLDDLDDLPNLD
ncbi:DUF4394 domain-containing protein [Tautonia plasticadhaerens]|uniref:Bifunctional hemolysin/adenylate cyclase n=1 Tax=Tautonia plasticadhaerens TaxID=2527974 RepID=A0A518H207_9BACT|nr:DUF4394 domain-containing protein [Tautonia plasticadhaerens]QDV34855.1 Bifunctional hemolysin/adenylate cyclase precursor [Tautonia plasticadhaerens]